MIEYIGDMPISREPKRILDTSPQTAEPVGRKRDSCNCNQGQVCQVCDPTDESMEVQSDDEDYITEFLSEHADHNTEHGRMSFDKWTLRDAVRALLAHYGHIAPQPDEPVKVPSTEEMAEIWEEAHKPFGGAPFLMSHVEYSRALLNRYGHPATPEGWQLVPKEPSRKMVLTGEEAWDKHLDKRLEAQASKQPFVAYPSEETLELCSRVAYRAMLEAAPKFGEEE